jgi:bacteriocin-like protein
MKDKKKAARIKSLIAQVDELTEEELKQVSGGVFDTPELNATAGIQPGSKFSPGSGSGQGIEFETKTLAVDPSEAPPVSPTAQQSEENRAALSSYYREKIKSMLLADANAASSFSSSAAWLQELRDNSDASIVSMLVGTKIDISDARE